MITENTRKQLRDYKRHGKDIKYLINYISGLIEDEDDFENMSWHPMSVNYRKDENNG